MRESFEKAKLMASDALKISEDFRIGLLQEQFFKIENDIAESAKKGGFCIRRNAPEHMMCDIEAEFVSRGFNVELVFGEYYPPRKPSKTSPSDQNIHFKITWGDYDSGEAKNDKT